MLSIRSKRSSKKIGSDEKRILIIDSAINAPTKIGMENIIKHFQKKTENSFLFLVGGYGTESLKNTLNMCFLGELSTNELKNEMVKADILLINQPPTTDALIRIIGFLIIGIPVVVNAESARSYFNMDGVYI